MNMAREPRIKAWHFTTDKLRDGRPVPAVGAVLKHEGDVVACRSGLHASKRLRDCIGYAPFGTTQLHRVELWGDVSEESDKLVARNRRILYTVPAESFLREFAREVGLEALLSYFGEPTPEQEEDYYLVLNYLCTGDPEIRSEAYDAGYRLRNGAYDRYWAARAAAADDDAAAVAAAADDDAAAAAAAAAADDAAAAAVAAAAAADDAAAAAAAAAAEKRGVVRYSEEWYAIRSKAWNEAYDKHAAPVRAFHEKIAQRLLRQAKRAARVSA
jgi:hypothetical protein